MTAAAVCLAVIVPSFAVVMSLVICHSMFRELGLPAISHVSWVLQGKLQGLKRLYEV